MKKIRWNLAITVLLLAVTTIISFCFFHFGNKYTANITVLYTLALILIALKTSGYIYGIIASIFCVFAVNYFFFIPLFPIKFYIGRISCHFCRNAYDCTDHRCSNHLTQATAAGYLRT